MAQVMSETLLEPFAGELHAAHANAVDMAMRYRDQRAQAVDELGEGVVNGLVEVRDAYRELTLEGQSGRITAKEFNDRLSRLRQHQRNLERRVGEIAQAADQLDEIEVDPAAWADRTFYLPFPLLRPEFSF